jgi:hypothetical protein
LDKERTSCAGLASVFFRRCLASPEKSSDGLFSFDLDSLHLFISSATIRTKGVVIPTIRHLPNDNSRFEFSIRIYIIILRTSKPMVHLNA